MSWSIHRPHQSVSLFIRHRQRGKSLSIIFLFSLRLRDNSQIGFALFDLYDQFHFLDFFMIKFDVERAIPRTDSFSSPSLSLSRQLIKLRAHPIVIIIIIIIVTIVLSSRSAASRLLVLGRRKRKRNAFALTSSFFILIMQAEQKERTTTSRRRRRRKRRRRRREKVFPSPLFFFSLSAGFVARLYSPFDMFD